MWSELAVWRDVWADISSHIPTGCEVTDYGTGANAMGMLSV